MVTTFYPPYSFGGDGAYVKRLANTLAQRGHQVDVIHCIDSYQALSGYRSPRPYDDHPNVTVHGLRSPVGILSPLATQQTGLPLFKSARIRKILDRGFDVIHYHNVSLVGGPKVLEYGQGIKLYTMHEYWLVCPTHVLFRYDREPCTERHCLTCTLSYKRPPQWWRYSGALERAVKHVDLFLAPSRFSKEHHQRLGLQAPIAHLPYFVPELPHTPPDADSTPADSHANGPFFLFVGRLERLKGLQTLFPLFQRYDRARLVVAGTGNYESRLRELAAGSPKIQFLGHLGEQELKDLYRRAVALIVPSICFEVSGMVILESFRQGTPVLVRNLGGMPELARDSGGGIVYSTNEELESGLDRLLDDPSCRAELAARGHAAYQRLWTTEPHLERYFGLIHEIAARRGLPIA
jgi:glycosyltransferase involved in cell wall biosynthesis